MSWHVSRRDILLVLSIVVLFGLFLQLDLSFRFTDSRGSDSLLGLKLGIGGRRAGWDANHRPKGNGAAGGAAPHMVVSESKARWGDKGAPRTTTKAHAPGWTVIDNVYLFNGTWYIVTDYPSSIPLRRMMISTGAEIWNDQPSINRREPTEKTMRIIFPSEAKRLWGSSASKVSDVTFLVNDPPQFLDHYYHFAAELLFGIWRTYSSLDLSINAAGQTQLPAPARMMMPHVPAGRWNDYSKMNSFILRAIFPSMAYEYQNDFKDRIDTERAYLFERVLLADRAAAFRGPEFARTWRTASEAVTLDGSRYWWAPVRRNLLEFVGAAGDAGVTEIDLEAYGVGGDELYDEEELELDEVDDLKERDVKQRKGKAKRTLDEPVYERRVFVKDEPQAVEAADREKRALEKRTVEKRAPAENQERGERSSGNPVITYVSRQDWGRRMLKKKDHESLVAELGALEKKYGWEVNIVAMDKLTRDEQIRLAARTTIMMGVHGNGLTHLLWMNNLNPRATIMEFFFPGGFAYDYEFTSRALGIRHYGWWGDRHFTAPNTPEVAYPEGFQGNDIPLDGKAVAQLIEQRLLVDRPTQE